jgi:hypothetical protein
MKRALLLGALASVLATVVQHRAVADYIQSKGGGSSTVSNAASSNGRRQMRWAIASTSDTVYSEVSSPLAPYGAGAKTASPLTSRNAILFSVGSATNTTDGDLTSAAIARGNWSPSLAGTVRPQTAAAITDWLTLDTNTGTCGPGAGSTMVIAQASVGCATDQMAGVIHDSRSTLSTTNWLCCSGNGTTQSCTDTGVALSGGTDYSLVVTLTSSTLTCTVNGTSVSKSTHLPTGTADLKLNWGAMNNANAATAGPFWSALTLDLPF